MSAEDGRTHGHAGAACAFSGWLSIRVSYPPAQPPRHAHPARAGPLRLRKYFEVDHALAAACLKEGRYLDNRDNGCGRASTRPDLSTYVSRFIDSAFLVPTRTRLESAGFATTLPAPQGSARKVAVEERAQLVSAHRATSLCMQSHSKGATAFEENRNATAMQLALRKTRARKGGAVQAAVAPVPNFCTAGATTTAAIRHAESVRIS